MENLSASTAWGHGLCSITAVLLQISARSTAPGHGVSSAQQAACHLPPSTALQYLHFKCTPKLVLHREVMPDKEHQWKEQQWPVDIMGYYAPLQASLHKDFNEYPLSCNSVLKTFLMSFIPGWWTPGIGSWGTQRYEWLDIYSFVCDMPVGSAGPCLMLPPVTHCSCLLYSLVL